jgi:hypothetical protein
MTAKLTQEDVDARSRELIRDKLRRLIDRYDGSDRQAREILRGIVAAQEIGIDLREFGADLSKLGGALDAA